MSFHVPDERRIRRGELASDPADGHNGAFRLRLRHGQHALAIASDGEGWEHVSVSHESYTPTWEEMCEVKGMFWDPDDCVLQYHPPRSDYVNTHPFCLHLWRPTGQVVPRPDPNLVGLLGVTVDLRKGGLRRA
jgi:hypothetical protein